MADEWLSHLNPDEWLNGDAWGTDRITDWGGRSYRDIRAILEQAASDHGMTIVRFGARSMIRVIVFQAVKDQGLYEAGW